MNVIITGASRGIGYQTALAIVKAPSHKVLALSRNEAALIFLQSEVDGDLEYLRYDLHKKKDQGLKQAIEWLGGVDVLINNAGFLINKSFRSLKDEDWQSSYETNLFGPVRLIRTVYPFLKKSKEAHILNISSMGGVQGSDKFPGLAAYSSSKAALINLTECLAAEFKEDNIKVNCLALGAVQTEMLEEAFPGFNAPVTDKDMGNFVANFALSGHHLFNGKILPVALSTP